MRTRRRVRVSGVWWKGTGLCLSRRMVGMGGARLNAGGWCEVYQLVMFRVPDRVDTGGLFNTLYFLRCIVLAKCGAWHSQAFGVAYNSFL